MQTSTRHLTGSISRSSTFLLGQDSRGHWVVQDKEGLCDGILERADALKFAMFDTGGHPRAVRSTFGSSSEIVSQRTHSRC
jgi:hypothetical protein